MLATPPDGEGAARRHAQLDPRARARRGHRDAEERRIRPEALARADEVFLTGTTAGVWPVESVDGEQIRGGAPGPGERAARERFRAVTRGEDPAFAHWLTPVKPS